MTDTTFYTLSREYAIDPNWTCIYDCDAGIDRRDEYMLDDSYIMINEDVRQIYIDESVIACTPKPTPIPEHELLKFLKEE